MTFSLTELEPFVHGACEFEHTEDGYLGFYHFTKEQRDALWAVSEKYGSRAYHSAGITLRFLTDATALSFDYRYGMGGSCDTVDVYAYGSLSASMRVGGESGYFSCRLSVVAGEEKREILVYLPCDHQIYLKNVTFEGGTFVDPVPKPETKVLWIGDSITQGFGPLMSGLSYVAQANRQLGYDILLQGVGGLSYRDCFVTPIPGYRPDKILVALGTNGVDEALVEAFYDALHRLYPGIPTLTVTPLWRRECLADPAVYRQRTEIITRVASRYAETVLVDGWELMPNSLSCLRDRVHPNILGCTLFADHLVRKIREIGF